MKKFCVGEDTVVSQFPTFQDVKPVSESVLICATRKASGCENKNVMQMELKGISVTLPHVVVTRQWK